MTQHDRALRAELDLLRSLARRRRAESMKLTRKRMLADRPRPVAAEILPIPAPHPVVPPAPVPQAAEPEPLPHRDAA